MSKDHPIPPPIPATGNGMKSNTSHDTFLSISGGDGNRTDNEVHLSLSSNNGDFCQGWFDIDKVLAAIELIR